MSTAARDEEAIRIGRRLSAALIDRRHQLRSRRAKTRAELQKTRPESYKFAGVAMGEAVEASGKGLLIGVGDSWFDYFFFDALDSLDNDFGFDAEHVAQQGTSMKQLAYSSGQLDELSRLIEKRAPQAILVSGGGNDVVDYGLHNLLNPKASGKPPLNELRVAEFIDVSLRSALVSTLTQITDMCHQWLQHEVPIVLHGYDYPVPDGRGLIGKIGAWLYPGFSGEGYTDLTENTAIMKELIDRLNLMQMDVTAQAAFKHVAHVDVRRTLSNAPADYRTWWENELHPNADGFLKVAAKFDKHLTPA